MVGEEGGMMAKLIGWDLFWLNCKRHQDGVCKALLGKAIEEHNGNVPDEDIMCSIKNCGIWECMENASPLKDKKK